MATTHLPENATMDPNETLKRLRKLAKRIGSMAEPYDDDALELAELVDALDQWITNGGFLPRDWKK